MSRKAKTLSLVVSPGDVAQIHEDSGIRAGIIIGVGYKWIRAIWPDSSGITVHRLPIDSRIKPLDYPLNRARRILRRCGRNFGITKTASKLLRG